MSLFQSLTLPGNDSGVTLEGPIKQETISALFDGKLTLGSILSLLLNKYIFFFAGLILLFMLIMGGFQMLTSAGNPEKVEAGKGKITTGLIGFLIIFVAYWLMQIIEVLLGFKILG